MPDGYVVKRLADTEPVRCPCGEARRIITGADNDRASIHVVDIFQDSRVHYHTVLTEYYYVLEGTGHLEVDDERVALEPGVLVMIEPGTRHRAVGKLRILNVVIPPFTADDEHFD